MGSIIILLTTLLVLCVITTRSIKNNRVIKRGIESLIKDINKTYRDLFTERGVIVRTTQTALVILAEIFTFVSIVTTTLKYLDTHYTINTYIFISIILIILSFIVVHYSIGYVLLMSSKIHKFIHKVEDKNLKIDFLLSYFITSTFLTVLLLFPSEFKENAILGLIGVGICYFLNLKVLLTLMISPTTIKSRKEDNPSFSRVIIAAILILIMLILNLYLGVCFVDSLGEGAFLNANGYFDLFYYTIITFTTIGYGDIIPLTMPSKILAIIISITSVICLTVFISNVLSSKELFKNEGE